MKRSLALQIGYNGEKRHLISHRSITAVTMNATPNIMLQHEQHCQPKLNNIKWQTNNLSKGSEAEYTTRLNNSRKQVKWKENCAHAAAVAHA